MKFLFLAHIVRSSVYSLALVTLLHQPVYAQNINGLFDLMGRAIEHDMERQRHQRQQRQQDEQYERQQRQRAAEDRARANQLREQEIALTRRLQAALSRLGFYSSKVDGDRGPGTRQAERSFSTAFGLREIVLSEADVSEVESIAERGFRTARETQEAMARGFSTQSELSAAQNAGFVDGFEFRDAQSLGFASAQEYHRYLTSDFDDPQTFRAADRGGFTTLHEFEAARAAGFGEKSQYDEFHASGMQDKTAFDRWQAQIVAVEKLRLECSALIERDDVPLALNACLKGIALISGEHEDPVFAATLSALASKLDEAPNSETLEDGSVEVSAAGNSGVSPADFLTSRAQAFEQKAKYECGIAVFEKRWIDADSSCSSLRDESKAIAELQVLASEKAQAARALAESERSRTALENSQRRAERLLEDVAGYAAENRKFVQPIPIARSIVSLREKLSDDDHQKLEQASNDLDKLLLEDVNFKSFIIDKRIALEASRVNARTTAEADLRRTSEFIEQFVALNLLSPHVEQLLNLQAAIDDAASKGDEDFLFLLQRQAKEELEQLDLISGLNAFAATQNEQKENAIATSGNGLAIREENRRLLEGNARDVILLGNFTPSAPNLVVNLLGENYFEEGVASYCWYLKKPATQLTIDRATQALKGSGAEELRNAAECDAHSAHEVDILMIERGPFLASNPLEAEPVVSAFERKDFRVVAEVMWSQVGAQTERDAEFSRTLNEEILAGTRVGFGVVRVSGDRAICLVVGENELASHEVALEQDGVARVLGDDSLTRVDSIERGFTGIQRDECSAIYANADNLAKLIGGLRNLGQTYEIAPVWINEAMLEASALETERRARDSEQRLASAAQQREATTNLAKAKAAEDHQRRNQKQQDLQKQFQQQAAAALKGLSEAGSGYLLGQNDGFVVSLFPAIASWKETQTAQGWSVTNVDADVNDYGTAMWKERRLEAIFANIRVRSANPIKGEYADQCFTAGYLIDGEFDMLRDAMAVDCDVAQQAVLDWKRGRAFESRWLVQP